jgi:type I restriction enzyme, S subunit
MLLSRIASRALLGQLLNNASTLCLQCSRASSVAVVEATCVNLGDVLERVKRPVALEPSTVYRTLGVSGRGRGLFAKDPLAGAEIAAATLYAVEEDDIVYSRLFARNGSFATARAEHAGCLVSNEFPTYRAVNGLLPEFFAVWSAQPSVWERADAMSKGTTSGSRSRLSETDFLRLELTLPSLEEQEQIVAAASAVDRLVAAQQTCVATAGILFRSLQERVFGAMDAEMIPIRDFARVQSGGTPSTSRPDYWNGDIPFVKTGAVAFRDITDVPDSITQAGLDGSSARLFGPGTVLVAMYGRGTVGRSAVLCREMATNQACAGITLSEAHSPRYLFHWLWHRYDDLIDLAEGTTNLTNISKKIIEDFNVPLPPPERQEDIAARLDEAMALREAEELELERLIELRSAVVAALLATSRDRPDR